jgi:diadenosine tetraphosphate (Ap4A) HIT family hydrolase
MGDKEDDRLVMDFEYWSVIIAKNQFVPGKCVLWCKRENALDPADATPEEWYEALYIIKKMKKAVQDLYAADWFNFTFLGNSTRHLHMHFVPRYRTKRRIHGMTFVDKDWGREYSVEPGFSIPAETLALIKEDLSCRMKDLVKASITPPR